MNTVACIHDLVRIGADEDVALAAPGRPPLNYRALRALSRRTQVILHRGGIRRADRVAMVLPNGPEMAAAFVAVAGAAVAAPLNPGYKEQEFAFYLDDLKARALLVARGEDGPAVAAARQLGVAVIELASDGQRAAGDFDLAMDIGDGAVDGEGTQPAQPVQAAQPGDTALILHTSGTTSKPKIVPLSQGNLCASAANIMHSLALTPADRCLNIMPLFHIHGLVAAVLASLRAGAAICCTPGFDALKFFRWMQEARPSWYTAVPAMHQAILARARHAGEVIHAHPLRFIRSSSSSLPSRVMAELEQAFSAPVIEAYGMTEAAHQMTSNPMPPAARKPGSVGPAAGPRVAIMDEQGALLGPGETGEVVIQGDNVVAGYENNPKANAESFTGEWFRTGDQGVMDGEGYLSITGRLKEIINRGGEKISPREVDEVLMEHDAVRQCVTFAMPHRGLGEEVAAAVVLREDRRADEQEIRGFCASRLADFKVPRKVLILDELPLGATGKLQRIGLAEKLGLAGRT